MRELKCIEKIRDTCGNLTAYKLIDNYGRISVLASSAVKQLIKSNKVNITNLKLTSDNRLISIEETKNTIFTRAHVNKINKTKRLSFKSNINNIDNIMLKARTLDSIVVQLDKELYAIENSDNILIVSTKQIGLPDNSSDLFLGTMFKSINFNDVDTSNVKYMNSMFAYMINTELKLENFNTINVVDMSKSFKGNNFNKLDLSSFNTSKVTDMSYMFNDCRINNLNIKSFNTSKVQKMDGMFRGCKLNMSRLDLSNFDIHNVISMTNMFSFCLSVNEIDLSSFEFNDRVNKRSMLYECDAEVIR